MTSAYVRLPADLQRRLNAELAPGERVLYAGQPDWRAHMGSLLAIFCFGLFWSSIAFSFFGLSLGGILGISPVMSDGQPASFGFMLFMLFFSVPFVAIGGLFLAAPALSMRNSRNTVHAITELRILNVYGGADAGAESYPLATINFVKRRDAPAGKGSLSIGYGVEKDAEGDPRPLTQEWTGIPDVKRAEAAIRQHAKWAR